MVIGRDGKIGAIRRGSPVKLWGTLPAPAVAISVLTSGGAAVAIMDGTLIGFSKRVYLTYSFFYKVFYTSTMGNFIIFYAL